MENFLMTEIKSRTKIGLIGGSDLKKILRQLGGEDGRKYIIRIFIKKNRLYKNSMFFFSEDKKKSI